MMGKKKYPDILILKGKISGAPGTAIEDLKFDLKTNTALTSMNPIMGRGGTFTWSITGFPSWAKSIVIGYGVWTISNGDVWSRNITITEDTSWTGSGTSLNLVNTSMIIKSVTLK